MLLGMLKDLLKTSTSSLSRRSAAKTTADIPPKRSIATKLHEEAQCRRLIESMPNLAEAHNRLGVVLKDMDRIGEAEAAFRRAIDLERDNAAAHYNLGNVLAESGRSLEAEASYRNAVRLEPNFVEAYNNLAVVLMKESRFAEAEVALQRAIELNPAYAGARRNLETATQRKSVRSQASNRFDSTPPSDVGGGARREFLAALASATDAWEVEAVCRNALAGQPGLVDAHTKLGIVLAQSNRLGDAETAFRRAVELAPQSADAHNNLGGVLKDLKRPAESAVAFERAIALNAGHQAAQMNLIDARKEIGRLSGEEAARRRVVDLDLADANGHYKLGLTLMALGKIDDAVTSFQRCLSIELDHAEAHNQLGIAFTRSGQFDRAIACYERSISINPCFTNAMANLAAAYHKKRDIREAARWARAALSIDPHQSDANHEMASILLEAGNLQEARQHVEGARSRQSIVIEHATNPTRKVLILLTKRAGNIPTVEFMLPTTVNTRINWVIESDQDGQAATLPDYDLAFNAMGDADLVGASFGPVARFAETCEKPLLNHPDRVARTARNELPALLSGIPNIVVPPVWRFAGDVDWDRLNERVPLMIRPVDTHGGKGVQVAQTIDELKNLRAQYPGPVYVCPFVDFRSADSWFRKYRIIFIDRNPYPYHLAISPRWMVHYASADMESHAWKLEEERRFLEDPESVLGKANVDAIHAIGETIDLEYAGIDFSVTADNRVLVFEANPTMLAHPEPIDGPLAHKNEYVFRIQRAAEGMLNRLMARS